jgi:hypothetical protein
MTGDRGAIMREAWRHWQYARRRGWHMDDADPWTWDRCLRFAQAQARARRADGIAAVERAMKELVAQSAAPM